MGNCFGKPSSASATTGASSKNFQGQGRTLGGSANPVAAPSQTNAARAKVPPASKVSSAGGIVVSGDSGAAVSQHPADPKSAAAEAAERRAKSTQSKGKLGRELDAQRSQTQTSTLAQAARDNIAARDADAAAQVRSYN